MEVVRKKGVARLDTSRERARQEARKHAIASLKEFISTPDDTITMKMTTQAIKNLTTLLLER